MSLRMPRRVGPTRNPKSTPVIIAGMMYGRKKTVRNDVAMRLLTALRITARAKPIGSCSATAQSPMIIVFATARHHRLSPKSSR
jgi:hypothetical protein